MSRHAQLYAMQSVACKLHVALVLRYTCELSKLQLRSRDSQGKALIAGRPQGRVNAVHPAALTRLQLHVAS